MKEGKPEDSKVVYEADLLAGRTHVSPKPVIGLSFDFRDDGTDNGRLKIFYRRDKSNEYISAVLRAGGHPYILSYNDKLEEVAPLLDGLILCGGRDLHPMHYGEEVNGSKVPPNNFRFEFNKKLMELIPRKLPVFGICWGMQFLNVYAGGSLIQHIGDHQFHANKLRVINYEPGSWLHNVTKGRTTEVCLHHQAIKEVGKNFRVTGWDDHSHLPHAFEHTVPGEFRVGVQFHPEIVHVEVPPDYNPKNMEMIHAFIDIAEEFKRARPDCPPPATTQPML